MKMATLRILMSFAVATMFIKIATGASYKVGGSNGGWDTSTDLNSWVTSQVFSVGDNLIFQYGPPHSVLEVTKADYDSCQTGNPLQVHSDGTTVILLPSPTKRYFICGIPGHCAQGMKLQVDIIASSTPPPTSPVNAPPPPSLSSPPPSAPPPTPPPTSPVKLPPSSTTSPPPLTIPPPKSPSSQTVSPSKSPSPSSVPSISPLSSGPITAPTKPLLMAPSTSPSLLSPSSSTPPQPSPSSANKGHLEFKLVTGLGLGMIILLVA